MSTTILSLSEIQNQQRTLSNILSRQPLVHKNTFWVRRLTRTLGRYHITLCAFKICRRSSMSTEKASASRLVMPVITNCLTTYRTTRPITLIPLISLWRYPSGFVFTLCPRNPDHKSCRRTKHHKQQLFRGCKQSRYPQCENKKESPESGSDESRKVILVLREKSSEHCP